MNILKPNLWKLLLSFLLFSVSVIVVLSLNFTHSCPLSSLQKQNFISLTPKPVTAHHDPFSTKIIKIKDSTLAILISSCHSDPEYATEATILSYGILAVCSYLLSSLLLTIAHRKR